MAGALEHSGLHVRCDTVGGFVERLDSDELAVVHRLGLSTCDLAVLRGLKRDRGGVRIIVVCDGANVRSARRAVDIGIDGVILVEQIETALSPTVAAVLAGQTVVPAAFGASLRKQSLSFREKQVLGLVVLGFTNSQIGSRLFLAESTVKSHLSSSFTKLGVASRSEAAALILDPQEPLGVAIMRLAEQVDRAGGLSAGRIS